MKEAGRLKYFVKNWESITDNPIVLSWLKGFKIPFTNTVVQTMIAPIKIWSENEFELISLNIIKLLKLGAISHCHPHKDQFISPIFLVPKPDGSQRFILNLKQLNMFIKPDHFKLEDRSMVMKLLQPNSFMATIDLKDAYFMLPIDNNYKKYLRFQFNDSLYEFNCLPFGLNVAPLVFTKLMKPVVTYLRSKGFISVIYLDDIWLMATSYERCLENIQITKNLLTKLGFIINEQKSKLIPSQISTFLGFEYNSVTMTVSLPKEKQDRTLKLIRDFIKLKSSKIRDLAKLIGVLCSICPTTRYGWIYTKILERAKFLALKKSNENYDNVMEIPKVVTKDLLWWERNIINTSCPLRRFQFKLTIFTDASKTGWGAVCNNERIHGHWNDLEKLKHINYLELLAVYFALKCLANKETNCDILLRVDNTVAISYINRMGGVQFLELNNISRLIWQFCESHNIWVYASYIKSKDNKIADEESRILTPETEWSLNIKYFNLIVNTFGKPDIDLFATRINKKCNLFVSWYKDPDAVTFDAFTINWSNTYFYAFPPFIIIPKVLQKICLDEAEGIMVVPLWESQPWYPVFVSLLKEPLLILPPAKDMLSSFDRHHPLWKNLTLVVGHLSGQPLRK